MEDSTVSAERKVVSLSGRRPSTQQEAEFLAMIDRLTRHLHYALIPIQTSIKLSRRRFDLPPLE